MLHPLSQSRIDLATACVGRNVERQTYLSTAIVLAAKDKHIQVPYMTVSGHQVLLLEDHP